jgi:hypothetical protein
VLRYFEWLPLPSPDRYRRSQGVWLAIGLSYLFQYVRLLPCGQECFRSTAKILRSRFILIKPSLFDRRWWGMLGDARDDVAAVTQALQEHSACKVEVHEARHRAKHKDGTWFWIHDRGKVVSRSTVSQSIVRGLSRRSTKLRVEQRTRPFLSPL